ncbi:MAG: hypothetical protein AAF541_11975 [Pseudomonadota bacterium]
MSELCYLCLGGPSEKEVPGYRFSVCLSCWQKASPGWPPEFEPSILQALARAGLLIPDRNAAGRYPRIYAPPADYAL